MSVLLFRKPISSTQSWFPFFIHQPLENSSWHHFLLEYNFYQNNSITSCLTVNYKCAPSTAASSFSSSSPIAISSGLADLTISSISWVDSSPLVTSISKQWHAYNHNYRHSVTTWQTGHLSFVSVDLFLLLLPSVLPSSLTQPFRRDPHWPHQ